MLVGNTGDTWAKTTRSFSAGCASKNIRLSHHPCGHSFWVQAGALSSHQLVLMYSLAWDVCRNHGFCVEMPIWKGKVTPARSGPSVAFFWDAPRALLTRSIQISHSLDVAGCQVHHAFHPNPIAPFLNEMTAKAGKCCCNRISEHAVSTRTNEWFFAPVETRLSQNKKGCCWYVVVLAAPGVFCLVERCLQYCNQATPEKLSPVRS